MENYLAPTFVLVIYLGEYSSYYRWKNMHVRTSIVSRAPIFRPRTKEVSEGRISDGIRR